MTAHKKTVRDYIKTKLSESSSLSSVYTWHNARPVEPPKSPFAWVRPLGSDIQVGVVGSRKVTDSFEIVVVVKDGNWNMAEDDALQLEADVESVIDDNPTLGGLVQCAYVSKTESLQFTENNVSFSAWKLTVVTWRFG